MFDGIFYNMLTDMVRNAMIALATYLGLTGSTQQQFVAGGLAILAGLWQWYENGGHQKIVDALKKSTNQSSLPKALSVAPKSLLLPFLFASLVAGSVSFAGPHDAAYAQNAPIITKAQPVVPVTNTASLPCTPSLCSGGYIGGTIGPGIIAGDFGAQYYNGTAFIGAEVGLGSQVYTDTALTVNENGFFGYQIAKIGGSLAGLLGTQPSPPSGFAASIEANVIAPYALAGAVERDIDGINQTGWTTGGGIEYAVSSKIFADLKYMYNQYEGGAKVPNESLVLASVNYKF